MKASHKNLYILSTKYKTESEDRTVNRSSFEYYVVVEAREGDTVKKIPPKKIELLSLNSVKLQFVRYIDLGL